MDNENIIGSIVGWSLIGGLIFLMLREDRCKFITNSNWPQFIFICFLFGPLTFIGSLIYLGYTVLGKAGKLFNR